MVMSSSTSEICSPTVLNRAMAASPLSASSTLCPPRLQDLGPSLQQQMRATLRPVHLLLLHEASAHDLIDRRFDKCRADPFAVSVPLAEIWDELLVVANVGLE